MILAKPEKPQKKITQRQTATYNFDWVSKKVSWDGFLDWAKETIPAGAKDVTLELIEDWQYDDCITYLELSWDEIVTNPNYDKEMKKYERKLAKWKKECQE